MLIIVGTLHLPAKAAMTFAILHTVVSTTELVIGLMTQSIAPPVITSNRSLLSAWRLQVVRLHFTIVSMGYGTATIIKMDLTIVLVIHLPTDRSTVLATSKLHKRKTGENVNQKWRKWEIRSILFFGSPLPKGQPLIESGI